MTNTQKYVGITIGPIFKTIRDAVSPAGLWYASTFFSEFTKQLCSELVDKDQTINIFSPYFNKSNPSNDNAADPSNDGIGKYHDRILFSSSKVNEDALEEIIKEAKEKMAVFIPEGLGKKTDRESFLENYLRVDYVLLDESDVMGKNIVFELNTILDVLELGGCSQSRAKPSYFQSIFIGKGKEESRNSYVKGSKLYSSIDSGKSHLAKEGKKDSEMRSIKDIAEAEKEGEATPTRVTNYYAVVYSDGDKVGTLLKNICQGNDATILSLSEQVDQVRDFSEACITYAEEAAKTVHSYGGMTIFAGGDDLLFLAPVNQILTLCQELNELFKERFRTKFGQIINELGVSLSFGVAIRYVKYPLYEALEEASKLMYQAKGNGGNQVALSLGKHSGSTMKLFIGNDRLEEIERFVTLSRTSKDWLHSLLHKLGQQEVLFTELFYKAIREDWDKPTFVKRFKNSFDSVHQDQYQEFLKGVLECYYDYIEKNDWLVPQDSLFIEVFCRGILYKWDSKKFVETLQCQAEKIGRPYSDPAINKASRVYSTYVTNCEKLKEWTVPQAEQLKKPLVTHLQDLLRWLEFLKKGE